jgi:hypothetical protein
LRFVPLPLRFVPPPRGCTVSSALMLLLFVRPASAGPNTEVSSSILLHKK